MTNKIDDLDERPTEQTTRQRGIKFDGTISFGTILTLGTLIFGGVWAMSENNARLAATNEKIADVKSSITDLSRSVDRQVMRLDNRIDGLREARTK